MHDGEEYVAEHSKKIKKARKSDTSFVSELNRIHGTNLGKQSVWILVNDGSNDLYLSGHSRLPKILRPIEIALK